MMGLQADERRRSITSESDLKEYHGMRVKCRGHEYAAGFVWSDRVGGRALCVGCGRELLANDPRLAAANGA